VTKSVSFARSKVPKKSRPTRTKSRLWEVAGEAILSVCSTIVDFDLDFPVNNARQWDSTSFVLSAMSDISDTTGARCFEEGL
jgi:hypothetical protein